MPDRFSHQEAIDRVVDLLRSAGNLLFITGAGLSADSGLPTYRGIGGLYESAGTEEGIPVEVALSGSTFSHAPAVTWKYLLQIEAACRVATFNRGHAVIAQMERHFERVWVLTQNVDGFHRAAGSCNVIDIHGDLHDLVCLTCGRRTTVRDYSALSMVPSCPECGGIIRPDVVLFGEMLPVGKSLHLIDEMQRGFDIVFSVGTSSVFPYIAEPIIEAERARIPTVEINPGETEVSELVDIRVVAGAAASLDAIWRRYGR